MDVPLLHERCTAHSGHSAAGGRESLMLLEKPNADFLNVQIVPIVYVNV